MLPLARGKVRLLCDRSERLVASAEVYIRLAVTDKPQSKKPRRATQSRRLEDLVQGAKEPGESESPRDFVQRRMAELARKEKK